MARIKIDLPTHFSFQCTIPVRITDLNYGGHVGNDAILSIIHEARMQFLAQWGYSEMNFGGAGLIMSDVGIEFKNETFYGDEILVSVTSADFSKVAFEIYYKLEKKDGENIKPVAFAKTGMICYDYAKKKISVVPVEARLRMTE